MSAAVSRHITCEVDGDLFIVALNRPDKLNAYTGQMGAEITEAFERGAHADVREGVQAFLEKRRPAFPGKVSQDMPGQYPWWSAAKK